MNVGNMSRAGFCLTVVVMASMLCACSGGGADNLVTPAQPTVAVTDSFSLPAPADIPHQATDLGNQLIEGGAYIVGRGHNAGGIGSDCEFWPDWPVDGSGSREMSYTFYDLEITEPYNYSELSMTWITPPDRYWLGLSDQVNNCWEWHECSGSISLPADLSQYIDAEYMLMVVAVIGETRARLDFLTLVDPASGGHDLTNMFFLHHSTGTGIVNAGDVRGHVNDYNTANGMSLEFWDHGYEHNGLFGPDGVSTETDYGPLTSLTDPPDLHDLWTSSDAGWTELRTTILANHEVVSFKSCYPASNIPDVDELEWRKTMYRNMRDFFDTRTDKLFIVMTMPPLNPGSTNSDNASRARQFSNWLKSAEYLDGHPNVVCFDLFNVLAQPDDASAEANMLRADYRAGGDSHPTAPGYQAAGVALAQFFCEAAAAY